MNLKILQLQIHLTPTKEVQLETNILWCEIPNSVWPKPTVLPCTDQCVSNRIFKFREGGIFKVTCPTINLVLESCQIHKVSFMPFLEPQTMPLPAKAYSFLGPTYFIFKYTEIPSE